MNLSQSTHNKHLSIRFSSIHKLRNKYIKLDSPSNLSKIDVYSNLSMSVMYNNFPHRQKRNHTNLEYKLIAANLSFGWNIRLRLRTIAIIMDSYEPISRLTADTTPEFSPDEHTPFIFIHHVCTCETTIAPTFLAVSAAVVHCHCPGNSR